MTNVFRPSTETERPAPRSARTSRVTTLFGATLALALLATAAAIGPAAADGVARATALYERGDYVRAVDLLTALASQGNTRAQAMLGFMYENGYGKPQAYEAAALFYREAANKGDAFAQFRLGLLYDKGHGVPEDDVLAYKWLDLAAARTARPQRDYYLRLRDAVASKMSTEQITIGQRLALNWAPQIPIAVRSRY
jgi:TPR repeat protein